MEQAVITRPETDLAPPAEGTSEVTSLVQMAIERNVPVELLERLVALKERVEARDARKAFFDAVSSFQDKCPEIIKSSTAKITTRKGGQYSYTYAPLDVIARTIRPILREHGLSYSFDVASEGKTLIVSCVLRHIDGHEERSSFPVPIETDAAMSDAQKNGAALTYGKRQSLVAVLGLTTADEDVDAAKQEPSTAERITAEQAANLSDLIEEVGADKAKFLKFAQIDTLADLPASSYARAVQVLEAKRAQ